MARTAMIKARKPGRSQRSPSLLLVDDDEVFRERMAKALRARGYEVVTAGTSGDAIRLSGERRFDHAVVDLRMPGVGGLDLLTELRNRDGAIRVVVLTGYGSVASAVEAMRRGAYSYLPKPADADDLVRALGDERSPADPRAAGPVAAPLERAKHELPGERLRDRASPRHHAAHAAAPTQEDTVARLNATRPCGRSLRRGVRAIEAHPRARSGRRAC
jgi:two-component system response regulator RegA